MQVVVVAQITPIVQEECEINGQVSYYRDRAIEIELKLKYPYYEVWIRKEKKFEFTVDELYNKKVIKVVEKNGKQSEYYIGYCEDEDEVFIMRKCDGDRKAQWTYAEYLAKQKEKEARL